MFIYNGKFSTQTPDFLPYKKKIIVSKEDILLTLVSSEVRRMDILFTFSITYNNTPIEQSSFLFGRLLDEGSVKSSINSMIKDQYAVSIKELSTEDVVFSFDMNKWLNKATSPLSVSKRRGVGEYYIKSNEKLPEMLMTEITPEFSQALCRRLEIKLATENKFIRAFKGSFPRDLVFQQHKKIDFVNLDYEPSKNRFFVTIRNDLLQILYLTDLSGNIKKK